MIIDALVSIIVGLISAIFTLLPVVTLADIPYIGDTIQATLLSVITTWNTFMITFPYAVAGWHVFLMLLGFELLLLVAKVILGSRVPVHNQV